MDRQFCENINKNVPSLRQELRERLCEMRTSDKAMRTWFILVSRNTTIFHHHGELLVSPNSGVSHLSSPQHPRGAPTVKWIAHCSAKRESYRDDGIFNQGYI